MKCLPVWGLDLVAVLGEFGLVLEMSRGQLCVALQEIDINQ